MTDKPALKAVEDVTPIAKPSAFNLDKFKIQARGHRGECRDPADRSAAPQDRAG